MVCRKILNSSPECGNMDEPQFPKRAEVEEPLLWAIIEEGGWICFSKTGRTLEIKLASQLGISDADRDFAALNYHSAGHRKWRNEIQFVREVLRKAGDLERGSARDIWEVSPQGYRRVGLRKPS